VRAYLVYCFVIKSEFNVIGVYMRYCPECGYKLIKLPLGGRERLTCEDPKCGFVHWNNPVPVVAAIVEHDNEIALIQNVGWPSDWFGLVTGFLEAGEMPAEAVLREVEEEIGLPAKLQSYVGMYEFYRSNQLIIAYHVTVDSHEVNLCPHEIAAQKWVAIDDIEPWSAGTGKALQDWLKTKGINRDLVDFSGANS
jgi:NAD+ diphosphatase